MFFSSFLFLLDRPNIPGSGGWGMNGWIDLTRTISTTAFPVFLTVRGKGTSRPVEGSRRTRKAWCGRAGLEPSLAVRETFSDSVRPRESVSGEVIDSENLISVSQKFLLLFFLFLLPLLLFLLVKENILDRIPISGLLGTHYGRGIVKSPRGRSGLDGAGQQEEGAQESHRPVTAVTFSGLVAGKYRQFEKKDCLSTCARNLPEVCSMLVVVST